MDKMKKLLFLIMCLFFITSAHAVLTDQNVAYFNMSINGTVENVTNGAYNGDIYRAEYTDNGIINGAYVFDGIEDYINFGDVLDMNNSFSISLWTYRYTNNVNYEPLINKMRIADSGTGQRGFGLFSFNNGNLIFRASDKNTDYNQVVSNAMLNNQWNHVVVTFSGTGKYDSTIYINGVNQSAIYSKVGTGGVELNTATPLTFGASVNSSYNAYYDGVLTEIGFWNRTLTTFEINELYNSGTGLTFPFISGLFSANATDNVTGDTLLNFNITLTNKDAPSEVVQLTTTNGTISEVLEPSVGNGSYNYTVSAYNYVSQQGNWSFGDGALFFSLDVNGSWANITANDSVTLSQIDNFNISFIGSVYNYSFSTTTGIIEQIIRADNYTLFISNPFYLGKNTTVKINNSQIYTKNFLLTNLLNVYFSFVDENSLLPINDVTYTLSNNATGYGLNSSTSTSFINISNIPAGKYELRYTSPLYRQRSYFFDIPISSTDLGNVTLYNIKENESNQFVLTVTDKNNQPINGIVASLLRRYVINNQTEYRLVEMMRPSSALGGSTVFSGVPNTVPYLFRVQNADGVILYQGSATIDSGGNTLDTLYLIDDEYFLRISTQSPVFRQLQAIYNFQYTLTNSSNKFWFSFSDTSSQFDDICLNIYVNQTGQDGLVSQQCSTANSGILSYDYSAYTNSVVTALVTGQVSSTGQTFTFDTLILDFKENASETFGIMGLLIAVLIVIVIGTGLSHIPTVAMVSVIGALIILGSGLLGIISVTGSIIATLIAMAILIMFVVRNK